MSAWCLPEKEDILKLRRAHIFTGGWPTLPFGCWERHRTARSREDLLSQSKEGVCVRACVRVCVCVCLGECLRTVKHTQLRSAGDSTRSCSSSSSSSSSSNNRSSSSRRRRRRRRRRRSSRLSGAVPGLASCLPVCLRVCVCVCVCACVCSAGMRAQGELLTCWEAVGKLCPSFSREALAAHGSTGLF